MDKIADYQFVRSLGKGGNGEFFLAHTPARLPVTADFVTVKVHGGGTDRDAVRRATRELQAFAAVRSPYLVTLFDAGQQLGVFFYAMEYLPGGSLESPARPLDRRHAVTAVADAASAAQDLHDAGLVHRAIRPGTVLLTDEGGRLCDLGLAQVLDGGATITAMGPVDGMEYLDPAVLLGDRATAASDVWSLGAVLHFACTGVGVWGEWSVEDPLLALRRVAAGRPELAATLDPAMAAIVRRCLDPDPRVRPRSAGDLAAALRSVL